MKIFSLLFSLTGCMLVSGRLRESILTRHADILQSRGIAINQSHPLILAPAPATGHLPAAEVNRFTGNWAGLMYPNPPFNERFTFVAAQFVVPPYELPPNPRDGLYVTAPWVGIDGAEGIPVLFQAGISINMQKTGDNVQITTYAWTEWFPEGAFTMPGFNFAPGDVIEVRIYSDVNMQLEGAVTFINHNTGQRQDRQVHSPSPDLLLKGKTVEWIVEKASWSPEGNPLTNFHAIHFTNAYAESKPNDGSGAVRNFNIRGTDPVFIIEGDTILTDVAISGDNDFWCAWKPHHI